jgi:flagellar hook-associated protein 3 FlgL
MRITNNMLQRDTIATLQSQSKQLLAAQRRVTSGLRIERVSDDPAGASAAMGARRELRALTQYQRNVDLAGARLNAEEGALDALGHTLVRARELAIAAGGPGGEANYETILAEVRQLLGHAVALGNTRFGDEHLFGGHQPGTAPFRVPGADDAEPPAPGSPFLSAEGAGQGQRETEISAGRAFLMNHDGQQVFLDSGALAALAGLADALESHSAAAIGESLGALDAAFSKVQSLLGDVGARANQLELTTANLRALEVNLQTFRSDLEEVDFERAVTELVTRQTAYQAAMAATSRVIGMTLTDYLR